jgi:tRNA nucleotidyltransferase (CCA-adding enzyme)
VSAAGSLPSALLAGVAREARASGAAAYLVGGAVRDALLGRAPVDLDVAVEGPVRSVTRLCRALSERAWTCEVLHERFGTATLRAPAGEKVDLAAAREETYPHPGALPVVTPGVPIGRDLGRRDFTVHAMALQLGLDGSEGPLLDPFGGQADLASRRIRLLHEGSLADDPTRIFRAVRYAARLGFELDAGFGEALRRGVESGAFERISGDRLRRALHELLSEENRGVAMELLGRLSVPSALVAGWEVDVATARDLAGTPGGDAAWTRLLEAAAPELRERVATRLGFSRALRRVTGCRR